MLVNKKLPLGLALGLGLAVFTSPAWAAPPPPQPGALNYVEGQASIDNRAVNSQSVGSATLNAGDVLSTGNGRAEVLLTPGIFMRVGKDSAIRMVAPELTNTRVELLHGEAMVEADVLHKEDHVLISDRGATTELDKVGVYAFNADTPDVKVYDGKATVSEADKQIDLKKGKELAINAPAKSQKFDKDQAEATDPLYSWSKLRSEYLSEATASSAQTYIVDAGGWDGPGWYWNPYWSMYSFIPGDGFFYNPFGWGLYSPFYLYGGGVGYPGFYGRGYAGRGYAGRGNVAHGFTGRGPAVGHAFARGGSGFAGRGFSGGGFHGGGFGGGFHGGGGRGR